MGLFSGVSAEVSKKPMEGTLSWNAKEGNFLLSMPSDQGLKQYIPTSFAGVTLHTDLFRLAGRPFGKNYKFSSNYGSGRQKQTIMTIWKNFDGEKSGEIVFNRVDYRSKEAKANIKAAGARYQFVILVHTAALWVQECQNNNGKLVPTGGKVNLGARIIEISLHGQAQVEGWGKLLEGMSVRSSDADGMKIKWSGQHFPYQTPSGEFKAPLFEMSSLDLTKEVDKGLALAAEVEYKKVQTWLDQHWQTTEVAQADYEYDPDEDQTGGFDNTPPPQEAPANGAAGDDLPF